MDDAQKQITELKEQIHKIESLPQVLGDTLADQKKAGLEARRLALIQTSSGAVVAGGVSTQGGDFTGRDDFSTTSASVDELARAFEKIYAAIEARPVTRATSCAWPPTFWTG